MDSTRGVTRIAIIFYDSQEYELIPLFTSSRKKIESYLKEATEQTCIKHSNHCYSESTSTDRGTFVFYVGGVHENDCRCIENCWIPRLTNVRAACGPLIIQKFVCGLRMDCNEEDVRFICTMHERQPCILF